jgi:TonB family protein
MSWTHSVCSCSFLLIVSAQAAPTLSTDSPGVTVVLNGSTLLHRAPVEYPAAAKQKGVQGTVVLVATLDEKGNVTDARVLAGPAELRRASLESVLRWQFAPDPANSIRLLQIEFALPLTPSRDTGPDFFPSLVVLPRAPAGPFGKRLESIQILGLSPEGRDQLAARLPVREGDALSEELAQATAKAVREFDEHLNMGLLGTTETGTTLQIVAPDYVWPSPRRPELGAPGLINGRTQ